MDDEKEGKLLTHPLTEDRGQKWLPPTDDGEIRRDIIPPILDRERDIARRFLREVVLIYQGYPATLFFDDLDDVLEKIMNVDDDTLKAIPREENGNGH